MKSLLIIPILIGSSAMTFADDDNALNDPNTAKTYEKIQQYDQKEVKSQQNQDPFKYNSDKNTSYSPIVPSLGTRQDPRIDPAPPPSTRETPQTKTPPPIGINYEKSF